MSLISHTNTIYYDTGINGSEIVGYSVIKNISRDPNSYKAKMSGNPTALCATNRFCWDFCYQPVELKSDETVAIASSANSIAFRGRVFSKEIGIEDDCKMSIAISRLESGVYFYSRVVRGRAIETERSIVSRSLF